ncbi:MAG: hypothetical protein ABIN57_04190 [Chitinophagaceae bacterium]
MKKVILSLMLVASLGIAASAQTTVKTKTNPAHSMQKSKMQTEGTESKDKVKSTSTVPQKMHNAVRPKHKKHHARKTKHKSTAPKK